MSSQPASVVVRLVRRSNIIFLGKPFGLADLREALALIFDRHHLPVSQVEPSAPPVPAPAKDPVHPLANSTARELEELWAE